MRITDKISYCSTAPSVVALGCFDGVHCGHASVIKKAVEIAKEKKLACIVFTFDEPPKNLFSPFPIPLITSTKKKAELIEDLGADILLSVPFTHEIAKLSPTEFAERILSEHLNASHIVCGFDYTFGAMAKGNTTFLTDFCDERKIALTVMPKLEIDGDCVSSTLIRELISEGNVERAALLLGRPYSISATVISDKGLARKLGFATANQVFDGNALMPQNGVYATIARTNGVPYRAITNVGVRPTVNGSTLCAETHIFDFCDDLYGKTLEIEFIGFIRGEKKFNSVDELRSQVLKDIETAKEIL